MLRFIGSVRRCGIQAVADVKVSKSGSSEALFLDCIEKVRHVSLDYFQILDSSCKG